MTTTIRPQIEQTKDGLFVIRLRQVPVNWNRTLDVAVRFGAPNTPNHYLIWRAASEYLTPEGSGGIELTDISLLGYGRAWGSQEAVGYAAKKNLPAAAPQQVFAIGEAHPHLHTDLGKIFLKAVCLQKCKLGRDACWPCLWFYGEERGAVANKFGIAGGAYDWFAVLGEVP